MSIDVRVGEVRVSEVRGERKRSDGASVGESDGRSPLLRAGEERRQPMGPESGSMTVLEDPKTPLANLPSKRCALYFCDSRWLIHTFIARTDQTSSQFLGGFASSLVSGKVFSTNLRALAGAQSGVPK
jgi:hypothetical protein